MAVLVDRPEVPLGPDWVLVCSEEVLDCPGDVLKEAVGVNHEGLHPR